MNRLIYWHISKRVYGDIWFPPKLSQLSRNVDQLGSFRVLKKNIEAEDVLVLANDTSKKNDQDVDTQFVSSQVAFHRWRPPEGRQGFEQLRKGAIPTHQIWNIIGFAACGGYSRYRLNQ